jgi:type II secretory pathway pseudopilin PulG
MNKLLLLLFKFKKVTPRKEAGFTTLEILVSLIIALLFVAVSMQSLVYAMAMKVQAQEKQRANQLIQEDIERINRLGNTSLTPPIPAAGNPPAATPVCNPVDTALNPATTPTTPARTAYENSYAQALWSAMPTTTPIKTIIKKIRSDGSVDPNPGGKQIALRRFHISSTVNNSTAPHRTLKVGYQVWNWDGDFKDKNGGSLDAGDEPIAETYVEIIPDVALQCP